MNTARLFEKINEYIKHYLARIYIMWTRGGSFGGRKLCSGADLGILGKQG
jgi:hypothetical protein